MSPDLNEVLEGSIILDSDGRKIIRGGKEFPLSDDEYNKLFMRHKDTGCRDCTLVEDIQDILLYFVKREDKANIGADPVFVGNFCLPYFTDHMAFYLFRCSFCNNPRVSYIHGGGRRLWCASCRCSTRLKALRHRKMLLAHGLSEEAWRHYQHEDVLDARRRRRPYLRPVFLGVMLLLCYWASQALS